MRVYYPGVVTIPVIFLLMALTATMSEIGVLPQFRVWTYWPVMLIATGLEEVYLWSKKQIA